MEGQGGKPACYGSGFFVTRTQILTNKHAVTCAPGGHGRVKLAGGERSYPTGHILDMPDLDVALVETQGLTAPPLPLDTARRLAVGDDIFVAGKRRDGVPAGPESGAGKACVRARPIRNLTLRFSREFGATSVVLAELILHFH